MSNHEFKFMIVIISKNIVYVHTSTFMYVSIIFDISGQ